MSNPLKETLSKLFNKLSEKTQKNLRDLTYDIKKYTAVGLSTIFFHTSGASALLGQTLPPPLQNIATVEEAILTSIAFSGIFSGATISYLNKNSVEGVSQRTLDFLCDSTKCILVGTSSLGLASLGVGDTVLGVSYLGDALLIGGVAGGIELYNKSKTTESSSPSRTI